MLNGLLGRVRVVTVGRFLIIALIFAPVVQAEPRPLETASKRDITAGIGHFSRSRRLLVEAVNEFDQGLLKIDPSTLMDPVSWRSSLLERISELERVLNPQPRDSVSGVKFPANRKLLGVPEVKKTPDSSPTVAEKTPEPKPAAPEK